VCVCVCGGLAGYDVFTYLCLCIGDSCAFPPVNCVFKSIHNSRNSKIQITVFIFVVNIDTESHGYVVCVW